jgi:hypothetical protein
MHISINYDLHASNGNYTTCMHPTVIMHRPNAACNAMLGQVADGLATE